MKGFFIIVGLLAVATLVAWPWSVLNEADKAATEADELRRKNDIEEDPSLLNHK